MFKTSNFYQIKFFRIEFLAIITIVFCIFQLSLIFVIDYVQYLELSIVFLGSILSALMIYLTVLYQQNYNKEIAKTKKADEIVKFLYYRLDELMRMFKDESFHSAFNDIHQLINQLEINENKNNFDPHYYFQYTLSQSLKVFQFTTHLIELISYQTNELNNDKNIQNIHQNYIRSKIGYLLQTEISSFTNDKIILLENVSKKLYNQQKSQIQELIKNILVLQKLLK